MTPWGSAAKTSAVLVELGEQRGGHGVVERAHPAGGADLVDEPAQRVERRSQARHPAHRGQDPGGGRAGHAAAFDQPGM